MLRCNAVRVDEGCHSHIGAELEQLELTRGSRGAQVVARARRPTPGDFLELAPEAIHREEALGDEPLARVVVVARSAAGTLVVNSPGPEPLCTGL